MLEPSPGEKFTVVLTCSKSSNLSLLIITSSVCHQLREKAPIHSSMVRVSEDVKYHYRAAGWMGHRTSKGRSSDTLRQYTQGDTRKASLTHRKRETNPHRHTLTQYTHVMHKPTLISNSKSHTTIRFQVTSFVRGGMNASRYFRY